ncbi:MAG: hypothetical protein BroJett030_30970 [Alphaproteobacteria bacterium]|nr:MAG: hypothetical protein BroJett030_30970 [Alphaproteobacteria bacterium]
MKAVALFARQVREYFGERVAGIYLYGSRARGDHHSASDADIVVVLEGCDFWKDLFALVDLAFVVNARSDIFIQPRPVSLADWRGGGDPGSFLAEVKRDARQIETMQ